MKKILFLIIILNYVTIYAQKDTIQSKQIIAINDENKPAEYPGGINALRQILFEKINLSKIKDKGIIKSEAQLIISEEGNVTDTKIIGNNESLNKEIEHALKKISNTKWNPAKINGKPVKYKFKLPIKLQLE